MTRNYFYRASIDPARFGQHATPDQLTSTQNGPNLASFHERLGQHARTPC